MRRNSTLEPHSIKVVLRKLSMLRIKQNQIAQTHKLQQPKQISQWTSDSLSWNLKNCQNITLSISVIKTTKWEKSDSRILKIKFFKSDSWILFWSMSLTHYLALPYVYSISFFYYYFFCVWSCWICPKISSLVNHEIKINIGIFSNTADTLALSKVLNLITEINVPKAVIYRVFLMFRNGLPLSTR